MVPRSWILQTWAIRRLFLLQHRQDNIFGFELNVSTASGWAIWKTQSARQINCSQRQFVPFEVILTTLFRCVRGQELDTMASPAQYGALVSRMSWLHFVLWEEVKMHYPFWYMQYSMVCFVLNIGCLITNFLCWTFFFFRYFPCSCMENEKHTALTPRPASRQDGNASVKAFRP